MQTTDPNLRGSYRLSQLKVNSIMM